MGIYSLISALFFLTAPALADIISGIISDAEDDSPLPGVTISLETGFSSVSGDDGTYVLNTDSGQTGITKHRSLPHVFWDGASGVLHWDPALGAVIIAVHDAGGNEVEKFESRSLSGTTGLFRVAADQSGIRFISLRTGQGEVVFRITRIGSFFQIRTLTHTSGMNPLLPEKEVLFKSSALHTLTFEKSGFLTETREAQGSQTELNVSMKKDNPAAWRQSNLTWYTSYPDPGSEECIAYNGCQWAGYFAGVDGKMTEQWVSEHNIAAVHERDFPAYRLKTLRLRQGDHEIDVTVYDMCADSDCDGCCTRNASETGFLIDIESHTAGRFGVRDGIVEWTCLDCGS